MKNLTVLFAFIVCTANLFAQKKTFHTVLGGTGDDISTSADRTEDNGYVMAGSIKPLGATATQAMVVKLNEKLEIEWQKTYDAQNSGFNENSFGGVIQTKTEGYILTGSSSVSTGSASYISIIKLNKDGSFKWSSYINMGVAASSNSLLQTADKGFLIAGNMQSGGTSGSDIFIAKFDKSGNLAWGKKIGTALNANDSVESVIETTDGGFVLTGNTQQGLTKILILKLDKDGNFLWLNTYEDPLAVNNARAHSAVATMSNNIFVTGTIFSNDFNGNAFLSMKLNQDGSLINSKLSGKNKKSIEPLKVVEDRSGNLVIMGKTWSTVKYEDSQRPYFLKLDSSINQNIIYSRKHNSKELYATLNLSRRKRGNYFVTAPTDKNTYGLNDFGLHTVFTDGTTACIPYKDLPLSTIDWAPKITSSGIIQSSLALGSFSLVENASTYAEVNILCAMPGNNKLMSFTALSTNTVNNLQWTTDEESEVSNFTVERSADGKNFKPLATLNNTNNYTDLQPLAGINYYRLNIPQADGSVDYSEIKTLTNSRTFNASVLTNPVADNNLKLTVTSIKPAQVQIAIINTQGKTMLAQKINVAGTMQNKTFNISALANGIYFIKITGDKEQLTLKFVKQ